jgi:two-component system phosphate regulon sensor histidine kinase PhoR
VIAVLAALLTARALVVPLERLTAGLHELAAGTERPLVAPAGTSETARAGTAFNAASDAMTTRVQTLRDEVRKLGAVIDSVSEGIVVLGEGDGGTRLVTVNEAALRLLGLPGGIHAGADLKALLSPGQWDVLREAILRRDRFTTEVNLDEPRQAIVRVAAVPVHDDFARPIGRALVLQDVTEERLLDNVKADFFTAMSHELRTPLSAIKGAAELLLDDEMPGTHQHFVQTIHRNADRLGRLVTDLLDLSKLESGRTELRLGRVDLSEIAADVAGALQPVAERHAQHIVLDVCDTPLTLIGDHGRVEQIVTNLVSNACQYTPEGGTITVKTWLEGDAACISVADDGVGISTVDQQHLFDKFYQGVNALTRKGGGSGLGLTIVKHLTELHGGRIAVQSKLGSGSTFTVRLPRTPVPQPALTVPDGPVDPAEEVHVK